MNKYITPVEAVNDIWVNYILEHEDYKVDLSGEFWTRLTKRHNKLLPDEGWRICGTIDSHGYRVFKPWLDGYKRKVSIHRLAYLYFNGNLDADKVVNHIDGNRTNNNVWNLELVSHHYNRKFRAAKAPWL